MNEKKFNNKFKVIFIMLFLSVVIMSSANSVFTVDVYVDSSAGNNGDGTSGNPINSVQEAIDGVRLGSSDARIIIAPGTYKGANNNTNLTISYNNKNIGFYGAKYFYNNHSMGETIIDAENLTRIFQGDASGTRDTNTISVYGITFINANGIGATSSGGQLGPGGGAIWVRGYTLNITNCTFINNIAERGGAYWTQGSSSNVIYSTFIGNTALQTGGAIFVSGNRGSSSISYSVFLNNNAPQGNSIFWTEEGPLSVDYNFWGTNDLSQAIFNNGSGDLSFINNYYIAVLNGSDKINESEIYNYNYFLALNGTNFPDFDASSLLPLFNVTITHPDQTEENIDGRLQYNWSYTPSITDDFVIVKANIGSEILVLAAEVEKALLVSDNIIQTPQSNVNDIINDEEIDDEEPNFNNETTTNNKNEDNGETNNNPVAGAATMKDTGLPLTAILVILFSLIGVNIRKSKK